jgi:hypothetical protein
VRLRHAEEVKRLLALAADEAALAVDPAQAFLLKGEGQEAMLESITEVSLEPESGGSQENEPSSEVE